MALACVHPPYTTCFCTSVGGSPVSSEGVDLLLTDLGEEVLAEFLTPKGEAPIGITLEDNAFRFVQGGGPVKIVYPVEGVIAAPDGIALVKGAPHAAAGKVFIDWCLSKPTQDFLVSQMFRRPVRIDGANPPGLPPLAKIKTIPYDFVMAAGYKSAYLKEFNRLRMRLGL